MPAGSAGTGHLSVTSACDDAVNGLGVKYMIVSDVSDIHAVLAPHLRLARDRDPLISMLHAASPPDSGDDEDLEDDHFPASGGDRWAAQPANGTPAATETSRSKPQNIQFNRAAAASTAPHIFERDDAPPLPPPPSALSLLLQQHGGAGGPAGAPSAPPVRLRIFGAVPGGVQSIDAPSDATFAQVIALLVPSGHAGGYDLLMADSDGDPDDDIKPPREKAIVDFGRDFYLKRNGKPLGGESVGGASAAEKRRKASTLGTLRVRLPTEAFGQRLGEWSVDLPYKGERTLGDLMRDVCRLQRVRLHPERHVFYLPSKDNGGGGVTGEPLSMGLRLSDVKLPHNEASGSLEIAMCPKPYADQRAADAALQNADASASGGSVGRSPGSGGGGGSSGGKKGSGMLTLEPVFSNVTAILYQEYSVVKINRRGVRQPRVLGLDNQKFRNIAPANAREDEHAPTSLRDRGLKLFGLRQLESGTKHAFFHMADLIEARLIGGETPCDFTVAFKGHHEGERKESRDGSHHSDDVKQYRYEAESPQAAAEIVAKLTHISTLYEASLRESSKRG